MNDEKHIEYVSSFLQENNAAAVVMNADQNTLDKMEDFENIASLSKSNADLRIVVSSEIFKYKLEQAPAFFKSLRNAVKQKPIILFHPSRIHPDDRKLILDAVQQPFKVMQGHDLETDNKSELGLIFQD